MTIKKVLVVDDNPQLRTDLLDILRLEGYEALGATNGQEGIHLAQEHQPDLIICDITMPVLDGFGMITALSQSSQTSHIPVIFLSAHNDQATIQKGLQLGAVAHIPKPFNLANLLQAIQAQIVD